MSEQFRQFLESPETQSAWDTAQSFGGPKLPEGSYEVELKNISASLSQKGVWRLDWVFEVIDPSSKYFGKCHQEMTSFAPNTIWKTKQMLEVFGISIEGEQLYKLPDELTQLVDSAPRCLVSVVAQEGKDGNTYYNLNVQAVRGGPGGSRPAPRVVEETISYQSGDRVVWETDGERYPGVVDRVEGNVVTVKFEDGDTFPVDAGELEPFVEESVPAPAVPAVGDLSEDDVKMLTAICMSFGLKHGGTAEDMIEVLRSVNWDEEEVSEEEAGILTKIGIENVTVGSPRPPKTEPLKKKRKSRKKKSAG